MQYNNFAISEKSDTFAFLNQKVYPSRAHFQTWSTRPLRRCAYAFEPRTTSIRSQTPTGNRNSTPARMAESVDALVSNTSGAIRAGSIPAPGTRNRKSLIFKGLRFFFWILQHICSTEWAIRTGLLESSVKTCHFTDDKAHFYNFVRKTIGFHGRPCFARDDRVHFYWKTALGTPIFQGIKSSFTMFLQLVYHPHITLPLSTFFILLYSIIFATYIAMFSCRKPLGTLRRDWISLFLLDFIYSTLLKFLSQFI